MQHGVVLRHNRNHNGRVFRALALMDTCGIASASVLSVMTVGITSGRGSRRDQSARLATRGQSGAEVDPLDQRRVVGRRLRAIDPL